MPVTSTSRSPTCSCGRARRPPPPGGKDGGGDRHGGLSSSSGWYRTGKVASPESIVLQWLLILWTAVHMWPRLTAGGGNNDAAGGLEVGYGRATLNMADGTDGALDEVEEEAGGVGGAGARPRTRSGGGIAWGRRLPDVFQSPGVHVQAAGKGGDEEEEGRHGGDRGGRENTPRSGGSDRRGSPRFGVNNARKNLNSAKVK